MKHHSESHRIDRIGWLRAAVLGANDGLISTSSLIVGVAAADTGSSGILLAGMAGLEGGIVHGKLVGLQARRSYGCLNKCPVSRGSTGCGSDENVEFNNATTPSEIKDYLDRYVVGQHDAKRQLSVAVRNHYKRLSQGSDLINRAHW